MRAIPIDRFFDPEDNAPAGGDLDWRRLISEGRAARIAADGGMWRIGQLAHLVERRYASGALKRFSDGIGESLGTVRRWRWVAGAYDSSARARFSDLSFSHFQAVAGLPDRLVWLERAQRGAWSVDRLTVQARTKASAPFDDRLCRPIVSAARSLERLVESADDRELARAARAGLGEALDDLTEQVARLRARLQAAQNRRRRLARVR